MGIVCHNCVDRLELDIPCSNVGKFADFPIVTYSLNTIDYRRRLIKRMIDIAGSIIGLAFTTILTPFVAIAIKLETRGPVFFTQVRIGKNGRRFKMYKFRSMYTDAEERKRELIKDNEVTGLMFKMGNDPRITKVGRFLRKTSIDEMPQFFNVLKGDMSLVGTRPPTVDEFEQYNVYYRRRLSITPGLTGMWQVSGRSDITDFDEVVKLDLEYIDNWSLKEDLKIMIRTIGVVLFGRGSK
jgi:exopolysaccharide biosynthesis polyprenyl glycosylphosphotransferase